MHYTIGQCDVESAEIYWLLFLARTKGEAGIARGA